MTLSIIVAMDPDQVIGKNGDLPWRIPEDLKFFRGYTMGKPLIMGRKTHESIGRPLPGRRNIVISRNADFQAESCDVVTTLNAALKLAETDAKEVMIIGGAEIYALALPYAHRIVLTRVHDRVEGGNTWFPKLDWSDWELTSQDSGEACDWLTFDRKADPRTMGSVLEEPALQSPIE